MTRSGILLAVSAMALTLSGAAASAQSNGRPSPIGQGAPAPAPAPSSGPKIGQPVKMSPELILKKPMVFTTYDWQVGSDPVKGPPVSTHLCLLTTVSGRFSGYGESVAVTIDSGAIGGARWVLTGAAKQNQLRARMTCVARDQFVHDDRPLAFFNVKTYGEVQTHKCADFVVPMFESDRKAAFFVASVSGEFKGGGERVAAFDFANIGAIRLNGCSGSVGGSLLSIGDPGAPAIMYRTATARVPAGPGVSDFAASKDGPDSPGLFSLGGPPFSAGPDETAYPLVPENEALCGLTEVRGKLQGYNEQVEVFRGAGYWRLGVAEGAQDSTIHASARCIARDQRSK